MPEETIFLSISLFERLAGLITSDSGKLVVKFSFDRDQIGKARPIKAVFEFDEAVEPEVLM